MRTAIGVGEPKLITWRHDVARLEAEGRQLGLPLRLRRRQAPLLQPLGQPGDDLLGQDLAQPLAELGELDPAVLASARRATGRRRARA